MNEDDREMMLDELFRSIELCYEGFVPVKWKYQGSSNWRECVY